METIERSFLQTMLAGGTVPAPEPECDAIAARATALLGQFNATPELQMDRRIDILKQALIRYEPGYVRSPIYWEYGHLDIARNVFLNWDCMFLDNAKITIGEFTAVGPRTQFVTSGHPLRAADRYNRDGAGDFVNVWVTTAPIVVEDNVWIGANVTVLPGVTIGARSMIGAGSVVTKSIPPDSLAFGNPCRVQRKIV